MRSSANAGPSGLRRFCSQLRRVWMLIPRASANCCCVRPTKRRRAMTSSPPASCARRRRSRCFLGIARAKSRSVNSRISSFLSFPFGFLKSSAFLLGRHARWIHSISHRMQIVYAVDLLSQWLSREIDLVHWKGGVVEAARVEPATGRESTMRGSDRLGRGSVRMGRKPYRQKELPSALCAKLGRGPDSSAQLESVLGRVGKGRQIREAEIV